MESSIISLSEPKNAKKKHIICPDLGDRKINVGTSKFLDPTFFWIQNQSRQGKFKVKVRSRQDKVQAGSRQYEGRAKVGQCKVKERSQERSRQYKHNLNLNYNLMGFDTIEINLVFFFL